MKFNKRNEYIVGKREDKTRIYCRINSERS